MSTGETPKRAPVGNSINPQETCQCETRECCMNSLVSTFVNVSKARPFCLCGLCDTFLQKPLLKSSRVFLGSFVSIPSGPWCWRPCQKGREDQNGLPLMCFRRLQECLSRHVQQQQQQQWRWLCCGCSVLTIDLVEQGVVLDGVHRCFKGLEVGEWCARGFLHSFLEHSFGVLRKQPRTRWISLLPVESFSIIGLLWLLDKRWCTR